MTTTHTSAERDAAAPGTGAPLPPRTRVGSGDHAPTPPATSVPATSVPEGTVYLLHFDRPYRHARYYCGWTVDLPARLAAHHAGRGARLLEVVTAAGIGYRLARTWPGDRRRERRIKRQGGLSRCCPLCGVIPRHPAGGAA